MTAVPHKASQLSPATQRDITAAHARAVRLVLQAEAHGHAALAPPVQHAVDHVVAALTDATDERKLQQTLLTATHRAAEQLQRDFAQQAYGARQNARSRARVQIAYERIAVLAWVGSAGSSQHIPGVAPAPHGEESDALHAHQAGASMAARFSAVATATAAVALRRGGAPAVAPALRGLPRALAKRVGVHATVQTHDAFADERFAWWTEQRRIAEAPPAKLPPAPPGTGPEQGLPYGWQDVVFDVCTAVLDRKTCAVCFGLDGTMVPVGTPIPGFGRPQFHSLCRCETVTVVIPEVVRARLPGIQIDYSGIKAEIRAHMAEANVQSLRHSPAFIDQALETSGSPETASRWMLEEPWALPPRPAPHAPRLPPTLPRP